MSKRRYFVIGGIVAVVVVVSVVLYATRGNHRPVITSLQAEPAGISPGGSCQIVCDATDPDGNQLSYNWSATGGIINGEGATVTWTAPSSSGSYSVEATVSDDRGGEATGQVSITVRTNHAPTIKSLVADANWTNPSGNISLVCTASDADHDQLSYEWMADGGDISGSGATVNWTAPEEIGVYNITVVVKDGYGGEATGKLNLTVNSGIPPTIEGLTVTPNGNPYLKPDGVAGCDYEVYRTKAYDIDCAASGTSTLIYTWSCEGGDEGCGEISGEGSSITWTAPNVHTSGKVTVTVTVSDVAGNSMSESLVFYVSDCTCPF
jgi:hypothetical protein